MAPLAGAPARNFGSDPPLTLLGQEGFRHVEFSVTPSFHFLPTPFAEASSRLARVEHLYFPSTPTLPSSALASTTPSFATLVR